MKQTLKLDPELVAYIKQVLKTAQVLKFDDIVIGRDMVRGCNPVRTAVVVDTNVPELPFDGIGIGGVTKLLTRMGLMETYTAEVELVNNFVMNLELKTKGMSVKYRCANPNAIKSPKSLKDVDGWTMELSPEMINQLNKGAAAMGCDTATFKCEEDDCSLILVDSDRNSYTQEFQGYIESLFGHEDTSNFTFHYDLPTLLNVIKFCDKPKKIEGPEGSIKLIIGQGGSIVCSLNNIKVSVAPKAIL
jgi:hypothetical protein